MPTTPPTTTPAPSSAPGPRSENLLPADEQVAEEVSLDQQNPASRRVGQASDTPTTPDKDTFRPLGS